MRGGSSAASASAARWTAWTCACVPGNGSRSSDPTAPARRRCCGCWPPCCAPRPAPCYIAGAAIPKQSQVARAHIGYLGHDPAVYLDLTAQQNLELFCDLYGVPDARERIAGALARVGLLARTHDPVRTFSRGMAQRLGIARLTLHAPRLLLLDEPYTGLDTQGARILDELLGDLGEREAVVLVTHELDRALELAGEVVVMRSGRVAARRVTAGVPLARFRTDYQELTA